MRFSIVFLALCALAAAIPSGPTLHAADQDILKKQQFVIQLFENIVGDLPYEHLYEIGSNYEFEPYLQNYENPSVVRYFVGLVKTGHVQPMGTPFSVSVSQLRKEVALLTQIFLGAKDYETFCNTACWARVNVNQDQFVKAFSSAILQRPDMHGVILPPAYEVFPHYFFDTRIIQKVYDHFHHYYGHEAHSEDEHHDYVHHINVNYTSYLPFGENQIAYFTEDIGLNAYYSYVFLSSFFPHDQHFHGAQGFPQGGAASFKEGEHFHHHFGHGAYFYYIHQQLLARYNLERLGQGLEPIRDLDGYYEHIETPFSPHLRYLNGVNFPGRDEHLFITPRHHNYELIRLVRSLERRIMDAIHLGHVVTPQGAFLSLYQPEGLSILGEIIEGSGHSINPRYYGSFLFVAKQLLGNVPEFNNIYEYTPSALELGQTAVRDPIFYQLFSKILEFFHYYQEALPAYQYNDVVVPGVHIENVDVSDLITYFSDFEVSLDNAVPLPVDHHHDQHPSYPHFMGHLKRLDHRPYEYTIHVNAEKPVPGAVVRVYVGPKYGYDGLPIDINVHRHYFFELDQFFFDITEGHNVMTRNSHQATGQSYDWPSVQQIMSRVEGAIKSQNPYYISNPQQLFGFPARLSLPKGTQSGFPLQFFVIISAGIHHNPLHYGPVVEENFMTYQPQHYQIVSSEDYHQFVQNPVDKIHGGFQTVEVVPEFDSQVITDGDWHWGYLYKKYPGSYYYPHWQQVHYSYSSEHHYPGVHHEGSGVFHGDAHHAAGEFHGAGAGASYHGVPHGEHSFGDQFHGVHHGEHHGVGHGYSAGKVVVPHGSYGHGAGVEHGAEGSMHFPGHGVEHGHEYYGSGHYPGASEYHGSYPSGIYQGWKGHEEHLASYYDNEFIGDIIGGAVSLDGMPLGYPFDRQLAHSAFYAPNIYIRDVVVFHHEEYFPEY